MHILNMWLRKGGIAAVTLGWVAASLLAHEVRIDSVTVVSPERSSPLRDVSVSIKDDRIVDRVGSLEHRLPHGRQER